MDAAASEIWTGVVGLMTQYGLDVVGAIVVLLIGLWASGWAKRMTIKSLIKVEQVDATLRMFFGSLVKYLVLAFTFIMVLNQVGVQTASLIAIMGAAGLAIGLALQGTLSNVASGVMLLLFRPLNVDQFVNAGGVMGTVKAVNLFTTEVATLDNVQVIVPNSQIWGGTITNYSVYDTRRMDIVMGIGYGNSIDDAMAALRAIYNADDRVMEDADILISGGCIQQIAPGLDHYVLDTVRDRPANSLIYAVPLGDTAEVDLAITFQQNPVISHLNASVSDTINNRLDVRLECPLCGTGESPDLHEGQDRRIECTAGERSYCQRFTSDLQRHGIRFARAPTGAIGHREIAVVTVNRH